MSLMKSWRADEGVGCGPGGPPHKVSATGYTNFAMESLGKDFKHSLRMFRRNPGFTITAVAALALGIGATVATFSVVNTVLLKPISAPKSEQMVVFLSTSRGETPGAFASDIKFNLWRLETSVFEYVSGYRGGSSILTAVDQPQRVRL